jgi:hypothetical protein
MDSVSPNIALKEARIHAGLSLGAAGIVLGVSSTMVSRMEMDSSKNNARRAKPEYIAALEKLVDRP